MRCKCDRGLKCVMLGWPPACAEMCVLGLLHLQLSYRGISHQLCYADISFQLLLLVDTTAGLFAQQVVAQDLIP
jgi:hypothetical protein